MTTEKADGVSKLVSALYFTSGLLGEFVYLMCSTSSLYHLVSYLVHTGVLFEMCLIIGVPPWAISRIFLNPPLSKGMDLNEGCRHGSWGVCIFVNNAGGCVHLGLGILHW